MEQDPTPPSPEEYPDDVREALGQSDVTHEGEERKASSEEEADEHLGAVETETSSVTPPMEGPSKLTRGEVDETDIDPREELTGG